MQLQKEQQALRLSRDTDKEEEIKRMFEQLPGEIQKGIMRSRVRRYFAESAEQKALSPSKKTDNKDEKKLKRILEQLPEEIQNRITKHWLTCYFAEPEKQAHSPSKNADKEEEMKKGLEQLKQVNLDLRETVKRLEAKIELLPNQAISNLGETVKQQEAKIELLENQGILNHGEMVKQQEAKIELQNQAILNLSDTVKQQEAKIELLQNQCQVSHGISKHEIGILQSQLYKVTYDDTTFTDLSPELMKGLHEEMKFQKPSKFQAAVLPMILTPFKDLIAQAHIGSGKTTCFVLGMLSRVDPNMKTTQALCICPTRERTIQNLEVVRKIGIYTDITSESAIPVDAANGNSRVREPLCAQIVIGTPPTIKRLMSQKKLSVTDLNILVFDEADYMLTKDGFQDDSLRIMKDLKKCNAQCQVLLFSTTFDESVRNFVARTVKQDHNDYFARKEHLTLDTVKQYKVTCSDERAKISVVTERILEFGEKMRQAIIFVNSNRCATMLHESLTGIDYEVTTVHGALSIDDREKMIKQFKDGLTQVLISTDLLARGIDQQEINLVVNYDLPVKLENPSEPNYEVYLHRIGRAGRCGGKGAIFSLVMDSTELLIMEKIDDYIGGKIVEVAPSNSEEDFKVAMKAAGLM